MDALWIQLVTFATAVVGAVLGIVNLWRSWSADRVKVRVLSVYGESFGVGPAVVIEVVNLSQFPITVTHIGFDTYDPAGRHLQLVRPMFTGGSDRLPVRLESRAAFTVLQALSAFEDPQLTWIRRAYIKTACGRKFQCPGAFFAELQALARAREA